MEVLTRSALVFRGSTAGIRSGLILGVLCCLGVAIAVRAQPAPPTEYEIKAAFLYNFAKFVEWPAAAFSDSLAPFVIGIVGPDPFGPQIDRALDGKTVHGRPLAVRRFPTAARSGGAPLLYFGDTDTTAVRRGLRSLAGSPVLTVGEAEAFLDLGGAIRFVLESNKVRFEIDVGAAEAARLKISSKLLRLARVLRGVEP